MYPIKYAVLELKVNGGAKHCYEDITKAFIASKCYVLEERKIFMSYNDHILIEYVVSFPYDKFEDFVEWYKINQKYYNFDYYRYYNESQRDQCNERNRDNYPVHLVSELFDTYEEAKECAEVKNSHLRWLAVSTANSQLYEKLDKEFKETFEMSAEYEKYIYENTSDMEVSLKDINKRKVKQ